MKFPLNKVNFFFVFLVVLFAISLFIIFSINIASVSVVEEPIFGESEKVIQKVEVYKNQYGIPHIIADKFLDAIFGVGFAQASDRLWQMDYLRRVAKGELSEIFGIETVKFDQYFRSLQLKETSELVINNLDSFSLSLLNAFSNGVNYYIEKNSNRLPIEFQTLGYKPKPWTPLDCILIGRLMAFTMNFSFWMDLTYFDIANNVGIDKAINLLPNKVDNVHFFLSDTVSQNFVNENSRRLDKIFSKNYFSHSIFYFQKYYPFLNSFVGSNTWVVQSESNQGKKAILASDPHLKLSLPPIWYQLHITSSKINIVGLCIPGIPLPLIGRNDYISWGITNGMIDDCDFFFHKVDLSGKYVLDSLQKIRITFKTDTIRVKNSTDFVYYQRFIGKDIIISDFLLLKDSSVSTSFYGIKNSPIYPDTFALTFKWTGRTVSNEVKALFLICTAENWNQFLEAKKYWGVPALNISYADAKGNIGLMLAGNIPIRNNIHPNFPAFHHSASWVGYHKLGNEFSIYNPSEGFLFNANNKTFNGPYYLSNYWGDPSRAFRIFNLLSKSKPEEVLNIEVIQNDKFSEQARFVLGKILPILESDNNFTKLNSLEKRALEKLKKWDYIFSENYVSPSIYQIFMIKFLENTLKDDIGETLFNQFLYLDFIATRKFLELIADTSSIFFDNSSTNWIETKEEIILKSFKDAIDYLKKEISDNINEWNYGKWHKLKLEHPFSAMIFLEPSFSLNEIPIGGNNSTINYSGTKLFTPGKVEVGPSARFIADMSDSVVYFVLPGGNSGQNMSKNYSDQFQLWISGGYISFSMSKFPDSRFKLFAVVNSKKE
ncbi:MAG: penicillin acylase family protein [Ignavibacteria bacterium]|nr:penicillin acylase family protein [Ignavibacteria bacterium]